MWLAPTTRMTPEPTNQQVASERTEDLSRFESEGGPAERVREPAEQPRPSGLQPRGSDHRGRILIVYATREHHTYVIADALAARLRSHGFAVEVGDASTGTMPPPQDYDVIVFGLPMTFGRESALISTYVAQNRDGLSDVPTALFTVSESGAIRDRDPGGFLEQFLRSIAWRPDLAAAFAGGEPFPQAGLMLRLATRMGYPSPSHEGAAVRTNWTDVQRFADAIATELATTAVSAERTVPRIGPVP